MTSNLQIKYGIVSTALGILAGGTVCSAEAAPPQTVLEWHGHRIFEDFSARSEVSPDGKYVLRTFVDGNETLLRLPTGNSDAATLQGGLHDFERAAWCGTQLLRLG